MNGWRPRDEEGAATPGTGKPEPTLLQRLGNNDSFVLANDHLFCFTDRSFSGLCPSNLSFELRGREPSMPSRSKEEVVQEFRVQSIQEATMRVIARKGMAAATMQEIAEEAGVAKGTIYLYFRDRDELVEKTFERAMGQLMEQVHEALDRETGIEEKIRSVMSAQLAFFSANREFFRLYLSLRMPEGSAQQQRRQKRTCQPQYRSHVQKLADVLTAAMERAEIRRVDPYRLALYIIEGSTAVILERLGEETSPDERADVEFITSLILDGIRKGSKS
jgi:AcrR family transcriptional regulator